MSTTVCAEDLPDACGPAQSDVTELQKNMKRARYNKQYQEKQGKMFSTNNNIEDLAILIMST